MSLLQKLIGAGLRPHVRRKARGKSLEQVQAALTASLEGVVRPRMDRVTDSPGNREAVNHWIGIERWSLARLRVALGEPFVEGSYHPYRMPDSATWQELKDEFEKARGETLELARQLQSRGFNQDLTVRHNDLGPLTVIEWFVYIDDHSRREAIRLR
ncbi:MAG: hypothetical protein WDA03_01625 [Trueperaceae bacterium]